MADTSELLAQIENLGSEAFVSAQDAFIQLLIEAAPIDTGVLRESFQATVGSAGTIVTGTITNTQEYSSFTDTGTAPHEITGNPYLAFSVGGVDVVVTSVQHPGTAGTNWWTDNMTDEQWAFLLQEALDSLSF